MFFQESQQGPLFANPMNATLESPYLAPYTVPLDLRYAFCRYNLIENYCHPIKCSFCRVILRY